MADARYERWADAAVDVLDLAMGCVPARPPAMPFARMEVFLRRSGTVVFRESWMVDISGADAGRAMTSALVSRTLGRLSSPFEGDLSLQWICGSVRTGHELRVKVGTDPLRTQDDWRRLTRDQRDLIAEQHRAMLRMFSESADVIQACANVTRELHGGRPTAREKAPDRTADAVAVLVSALKAFTTGQGAPSATPPQPWSPPPNPPATGPPFDAWALVGMPAWPSPESEGELGGPDDRPFDELDDDEAGVEEDEDWEDWDDLDY